MLHEQTTLYELCWYKDTWAKCFDINLGLRSYKCVLRQSEDWPPTVGRSYVSTESMTSFFLHFVNFGWVKLKSVSCQHCVAPYFHYNNERMVTLNSY